VGPQRADLLKKELNIFTFGDLLEHFPYRHIDRTKVNLISEITPALEFAQVAAVLSGVNLVPGIGMGAKTTGGWAILPCLRPGDFL
jgi:ATP-dependent DNA helicase RecG